MAFDGFFISKLIAEINPIIENSRLEKMRFNGETEFTFNLFHRGNKNTLLIDLDPKDYSFYLTSKEITNQPNEFSNTLKRYLEGSILKEITQYKTDRVISFIFLSSDILEGKVTYELIFEAMGKHANLFLVSNGIIIDCYKKMVNENLRTLLPKAKFEFFPSNKRSFYDIDYSTITSSKDLVDTYLGISPLLANYLINNQINLQNVITDPVINSKTNQYYCFNIFEEDVIHFSSLSELLDNKEKKLEVLFKKETNFITKHLKKLTAKKETLLLSLDEAKNDLHYKEYGDLIYSSNLDLKKVYSDIEGIKLDITKTLNQNAQNFYKKYQKAKRGISHIENQINLNNEKIELFTSLLTDISYTDNESINNLRELLIPYGLKVGKKLKKKKTTKKINVKTIYHNDDIIMIGKNSLENEYLIHELANKNDYWFHVKDTSGSHVVLRTNHLDEKNIRLSAYLAAYYSKYRYSSSIPIDYTEIRNLRKIPKKPLYSVTYSKFKTIYVDINLDFIKKHIV